MAVRLTKLNTQFVVGEQVKAVDLNDTFDNVSKFNNIREITEPTEINANDDIVILKPNNGTNSYTNVSMGGDYFHGDKNISFDGTHMFFQASNGTLGFGKFNVFTWAYTYLGAGQANGTTCMAIADDYIFYTDYTTSFRAIPKAGGTAWIWQTMPANVYAVCYNPNEDAFYLAGYSGTVYKCTRGGVITTYFTSSLWTNTVVSMWCDNSNNLYITAGSSSWRITGGTSYTTVSVIPQMAGTYNIPDNSIYFRRVINGLNYFCKFNLTTETEVVLTKAQYQGSCALSIAGGDYFIEGNNASANQASYLHYPSSAKTCVALLPTPSNAYLSKDILITAPYGFTNAPFISGKILVDINPTSSNNVLSLVSIPYSGWASSQRSFRCICDGTYWIILRQ